MKNKIIYFIKLVICFLLFYFISDILKYLLLIFNVDYKSLSIKGLVIYQLIASLIIFITLIILYFKDYKKDFKEFKNNLSKNIVYIIKMFVLFIILKFIITFISVGILLLLGYDASLITSVNQELIESYVKTAPIMMLISSSIIAPIYEEGLFRLGFRKIINNKFVFILVSGTLFGLMHIFPLENGVTLILGLIQSITYVTMGIFLAYIYAKRDNIFISTGVHFLNNIISMLAMINML